MDYEMGSMDGAYKGRLHVALLFIGRKSLTDGQKEYNNVHGSCRARIEHLFARMWHWGIVRDIWRGSGTKLHEYVRVLLHLQQALISKTSTVPSIWSMGTCTRTCMGCTYKRVAMMMRMLWVMMGMYVPFVAPSLTLRRCPCVHQLEYGKTGGTVEAGSNSNNNY